MWWFDVLMYGEICNPTEVVSYHPHHYIITISFLWSKHVRSTLLAPFKSIIVFLTVVTVLHIRCPELTSIHLKTGSPYPWTTAHLVSLSPPRPWKPLCYPLFVSSSFWVSTCKWDDTVFVVFKQLSVEW